MPEYTSPELYSLYRAFKDKGWQGMCPFFFGTRKEPATAVKSFENLKAFKKRFNHFDCKFGESFSGVPFSSCKRIIKYGSMYWMIYYASYNDLPLYINTYGYNIIASWRMKLGK